MTHHIFYPFIATRNVLEHLQNKLFFFFSFEVNKTEMAACHVTEGTRNLRATALPMTKCRHWRFLPKVLHKYHLTEKYMLLNMLVSTIYVPLYVFTIGEMTKLPA